MSALLTNATTAGAGDGVEHSGTYSVLASGVFDGAIVELEISLDDVTYVYASNSDKPPMAVFTRPGTLGISFNGTHYIRAVLRNAGPLTNVSVSTNA